MSLVLIIVAIVLACVSIADPRPWLAAAVICLSVAVLLGGVTHVHL